MIDRFLRFIGALPDMDGTAKREQDRLKELRKADAKQERKLKAAEKALVDSDPNQLTEREFMERILSIEMRRDGEKST